MTMFFFFWSLNAISSKEIQIISIKFHKSVCEFQKNAEKQNKKSISENLSEENSSR
jgi:peroxiredoxin family protein